MLHAVKSTKKALHRKCYPDLPLAVVACEAGVLATRGPQSALIARRLAFLAAVNGADGVNSSDDEGGPSQTPRPPRRQVQGLLHLQRTRSQDALQLRGSEASATSATRPPRRSRRQVVAGAASQSSWCCAVLWFRVVLWDAACTLRH